MPPRRHVPRPLRHRPDRIQSRGAIGWAAAPQCSVSDHSGRAQRQPSDVACSRDRQCSIVVRRCAMHRCSANERWSSNGDRSTLCTPASARLSAPLRLANLHRCLSLGTIAHRCVASCLRLCPHLCCVLSASSVAQVVPHATSAANAPSPVSPLECERQPTFPVREMTYYLDGQRSSGTAALITEECIDAVRLSSHSSVLAHCCCLQAARV